MKKSFLILSVLLFLLSLTACGEQSSAQIKITIPANCAEDFVFASEQIRGTDKSILQKLGMTRDAGARVPADFQVPSDVGVIFEQADSGLGEVYASADTKEVQLVQDTWYRVGVTGKNATDQDLQVTLTLQNAETRIPAVK